MTLKTRRYIFFGLFFLFIAFGTGIILYSQGWRLIREGIDFKLQKTGAIYVRSSPQDVLIKINDKTFPSKFNILQSGTLIDNLLPKKYQVTLEKDGYLPWRKDLTVEPALVSKITDIVLVPQEIKKEVFPTNYAVDKFWVSPERYFIFKGGSALYYLKNNTPVKLRGDQFVGFSSDGKNFLSKDSQKKIYYFYQTANLSKVINVNEYFKNIKGETNIEKVVFYKKDSAKLVVQDKKELNIFDWNRPSSKIVSKLPLVDWYSENSDIYYIKKLKIENATSLIPLEEYRLFSFNDVLEKENLISSLSKDLILKEPKIIVLEDKILFSTKDGALYMYLGSDGVRRIAESATGITLSPDKKKFAFFDKNSAIYIYFLKNDFNGINKEEGELISLSLYQKKGGAVKNVSWFDDSYHLIVEYLENGTASLDFTEIDNRSPINVYPLVENFSQFFYEPRLNQFYFNKNKILYYFTIN